MALANEIKIPDHHEPWKSCSVTLENVKSIISLSICVKIGPLSEKGTLVDGFGYHMFDTISLSVRNIKLVEWIGNDLYMHNVLRLSRQQQEIASNLVLLNKSNAEREYIATTGYNFITTLPFDRNLFSLCSPDTPLHIDISFNPLRELVITDRDINGTVNVQFIVCRNMSGKSTKSAHKRV